MNLISWIRGPGMLPAGRQAGRRSWDPVTPETLISLRKLSFLKTGICNRQTLINVVVYEDLWRHNHGNVSKHTRNHYVFHYSVMRNRGMQNQQYSLRKTCIYENEKSVRESLINLVVY